MNIETIFNLCVVIFTAAQLMSGGLEANIKQAFESMKSMRMVLLMLLWGWVVGPALAYLLTIVLPLSEGAAAGLLLVSLAPIAPFVPLAVTKARGDMVFTSGYIILATIATVVLMPIMAPLIIKGLTVSTLALAKPLFTLVLFPLLLGIAIKTYLPKVAVKIFPWVKKIGGIFLLITLGLVIYLYGKDMLNTVGSFAPGAIVILLVVLGILSYKIGFGLQQNQRSSMSIGMCSRNISACFVAFFGITNPPAGMLVLIVLVVVLHVPVGFGAAFIFGKKAGQTTTTV